MNIYEKMNSAIQCNDLLICGQRMIEFVDAALPKNNRATLVKHFYQRLREWALVKYAFDNIFNNSNDRYYICDGVDSVAMYVALAMPSESSPVKSLNTIKEFGQQIITQYTEPIGEGISKEMLLSILKYLDQQYSFSAKVFNKQKAVFILFPYSHVLYNSECLIINNNTDIIQHIFLYHMKERGNHAPNPEAVLFHELGHALHARCFGNITSVPIDVLNFLEQLCFPTIKQLGQAEQCEIFADVLSIGLMYQTPFEKYNLFKQIHPDDKAAFKLIVENLVSSLKNS